MTQQPKGYYVSNYFEALAAEDNEKIGRPIIEQKNTPTTICLNYSEAVLILFLKLKMLHSGAKGGFSKQKDKIKISSQNHQIYKSYTQNKSSINFHSPHTLRSLHKIKQLLGKNPSIRCYD